MQNLEPPASIIYDAFISYSRKDIKFAEALKKALEQTPVGEGQSPRCFKIFLDKADITGTGYYQTIDTTLRSCRKLILLCSPNARNSHFANDEVRRFARMNGAKDIIPILVEGLPNDETPEQEELKAFPDSLENLMKIPLPADIEKEMPLAVDYRYFNPDMDSISLNSYEAPWRLLLDNLKTVVPTERDIFVCYSEKDRDFAAGFKDVLEKYVPPKGVNLPKKPLRVFSEAADGYNSQNVMRALITSRKMVVIGSPNAYRDDKVQDRVLRYSNYRGAENIISILIAGKANHELKKGDDDSQRALPDGVYQLLPKPTVADYIGFKGSKGFHKGDYKKPWFETLANIYGIEPKDLEERDRKRTMNQLSAIGMIALIMITALTTISIIAMNQQNVAIEESHKAERAREGEEKERLKAEKAAKDAIEQRNNAIAATRDAIEQRKDKEKERLKAEKAAKDAIEQRNNAIAAKDKERQALKNQAKATAEAQKQRDNAQLQQCIADEQRGKAAEQAKIATINEKKAIKALQTEQALRVADKLRSHADIAKLWKYQNPIMSAALATSSIAALPDLRKNLQDNEQSSENNNEQLVKAIFDNSLEALQETLPLTLLSQTIKTDGAEKAVFSRDGKHLIAISAGGKGQIWTQNNKGNAMKQEQLWQRADNGDVTNPDLSILPFLSPGNPMKTTAVTISSDGKYIAVGQSDGDVTFGELDPARGEIKPKPSTSISIHKHVIGRLAFNNQSDNPRLATTTVSWRSSLSDIEKSREQWKMPKFISRQWDGLFGTTRVKLVTALAFSPGNKWLALGREDGAVELRDVENGTLRRYWKAHKGAVTGIAFDPSDESEDRLALVTVSKDKTIILWSLSDQTSFRKFAWYSLPSLFGIEKHPADPEVERTEKLPPILGRGDWAPDDAIAGVAFSKDGKLLATVSDDRKLAIWDLKKFLPMNKLYKLISLTAHDSRINHVSFNEYPKPVNTDKYQIVTVSSVDKTVRLWNLPSVQELNDLKVLHDGLEKDEDSFRKNSLLSVKKYLAQRIKWIP